MAKTTGSLQDVIAYYHNDGNLSEEEEALVTRYFFERQSQRGTTTRSVISRVHELLAAVRCLHQAGGRLDRVDTQKVLEAVSRVRAAGLSKNYTHRTIQTFKAFLFWYSEEYGGIDERKIRKIRSPGMDWHTKRNEDLLTRGEVDQVLAACQSSRDRVIVAVLYDGGFRPGELPTMTWKDLIKDDYGYRMEFVTPKTGHERFIRFTMAVPYINAWRQDYPHEVLPGSPLFLQTMGRSKIYRPLTLGGIQSMTKRLRKRTGLQDHTRDRPMLSLRDGLQAAINRRGEPHAEPHPVALIITHTNAAPTGSFFINIYNPSFKVMRHNAPDSTRLR